MMTNILSGESFSIEDRIKTHLLNDDSWDIENSSSLCATVCTLSSQEIVDHPANNVKTLLTTDLKYTEIREAMGKTMRKKYTRLRIDSLCNDFLKAFYLLRREEYFIIYGAQKVKENQWFHGTVGENIENISKNNFNWRLYGSSNGCSFGRGLYFSPSAGYSSWYCGIKKRMVLVMASVLTADNYCAGKSSTVIPPYCDQKNNLRYDTSKYRNNVFVKYNDDEFYPIFIIHFQSFSIARRNMFQVSYKEPEEIADKPEKIDKTSDDIGQVPVDLVAKEDELLNAVIVKFNALGAADKCNVTEAFMKSTVVNTNCRAAVAKVSDKQDNFMTTEKNKGIATAAAKKKKRFLQYRKKKLAIVDSTKEKFNKNTSVTA